MSDQRISRTVAKLSVVVVGMFAFVFVVMVPLYNTFCEVFGLNGKYSGKQYEVVQTKVDETRKVRVVFVASRAEGMPWDFHPHAVDIQVHPGAVNNIAYYAKNVTGKDMVAQAVPSFVPPRAAQYFHKTECFCFNRQPLVAGGEADLALQFIVDQDLPADITEITLSYTIFDVTDRETKKPVAAR
ncbi:MAG: cytochrome c oxidase assembly protein [Spongiibacteraceae bacterium]